MATKSEVATERGAIDRGAELSEQVLVQIKEGQESAIEAVRKFMESVDRALPPEGEEPSRHQEIVDSALEMSEKLVKTQYDFLTNVVRSAGRSLGATEAKGR